jgi:hypothetical protein
LFGVFTSAAFGDFTGVLLLDRETFRLDAGDFDVDLGSAGSGLDLAGVVFALPDRDFVGVELLFFPGIYYYCLEKIRYG